LGHNWTQGVPVEIVPLAHTKVLRDLYSLGAKNPQLRMGGKAKAGPIITDNGNFIIDAHFGEIADPQGLAKKIKELVGDSLLIWQMQRTLAMKVLPDIHCTNDRWKRNYS